MCLLAFLHHVHRSLPLVVAANRDELLARPAVPMTVLRSARPRILGGRDEVAGGSWLAVNEHGVVAGVTNVPSRRRDPSRRSRGELPLALARHATAKLAVVALAREIRPADYNPCWLLVGDARSLHYVDLSGDSARFEELPPGIHILENRPLGARSPKVDRVRERLAGRPSAGTEALVEFLAGVLRDHRRPPKAEVPPDVAELLPRPLATEAACVHAGPYGTRSSSVLLVRPRQRPRLWYTEGPPCRTPFLEATGLWDAS